jgi:type II secretory pathway component PulJ
MWSRRTPGEPPRSAGFVLVEVLVTAAVAAVLLAAVMRAYSAVWSSIGAVREETAAMLVARAVVEASTPRSNLAPLTQEGRSGSYAWKIAITSTGVLVTPGLQFGQPQPEAAAQQQEQPDRPRATDQAAQGQQSDQGVPDPEGFRQQPWTLFRVAVAVQAPSGRRTSFETFRLGRPAAR